MIQTLTEDSYANLLQRFMNAVSWIAQERQVDLAKKMVSAIQEEWKRRRTLRDTFVCFDRPEVGMLAALGYHVGHIQGQPSRIRRQILKYILEGELPMVHSANYTDEWGEPNSSTRYWKLVRFLQNNIESNQTKLDMKLAVKQWSEDLLWVEHYCSPRV